MPCSYWAYIDATVDPARVRVESTCSLYGGPPGAATAWIREPRGGRLQLEYVIPQRDAESLAATPCTAVQLPQPWPPYAAVDAEIVFDARPGVLVYGLPVRRSTVITLTQRTLLEGRTNGVQAVTVDNNDVIDDAAAHVDGWLVLATLPPLVSRLHDLEDARRCALSHEGLEGWGRCLWRRGRGYTRRLLEDLPAEPWASICLNTRLYAGSLVEAGVNPLRWLLRVRGEAGPWSPLRLRGRLLRVAAPRARVALARIKDDTFTLHEESLGEGIYDLAGWDAAGLVCRHCLEPLREG